uniref:Uncharacterized protein n=1 Tax=Anguilla anguilla TaxID=7936 RepID=A0A0E9RBI8_ANGAN
MSTLSHSLTRSLTAQFNSVVQDKSN